MSNVDSVRYQYAFGRADVRNESVPPSGGRGEGASSTRFAPIQWAGGTALGIEFRVWGSTVGNMMEPTSARAYLRCFAAVPEFYARDNVQTSVAGVSTSATGSVSVWIVWLRPVLWGHWKEPTSGDSASLMLLLRVGSTFRPRCFTGAGRLGELCLRHSAWAASSLVPRSRLQGRGWRSGRTAQVLLFYWEELGASCPMMALGGAGRIVGGSLNPKPSRSTASLLGFIAP